MNGVPPMAMVTKINNIDLRVCLELAGSCFQKSTVFLVPFNRILRELNLETVRTLLGNGLETSKLARLTLPYISLTTHRCQYISMTCSSIDVDPGRATYAPACDHMVHAALQSHSQGQPRQQGVRG